MKNIKIIGTVSAIIIIGMIYINTPYDEKEYLSKNYASVNLESNEVTGLDILSKDLKDKKIVLTGESHGLDKSYKMKFKMLKYLQEEIGVNYLISELGYADAHFLNKYLDTGDEKILMDFFANYKSQTFSTEGQYELYKSIYEFNQTLPSKQRIKIIGVDINTFVTDKYILDIIQNKNMITSELDILLNELKDFDYYAQVLYKGLNDKVNDLLKDIDNNTNTYIEMFGDNFDGFEYSIRNLAKLSQSMLVDKKDRYNLRDLFIYENFKEIDDKLENPIYFGQFGGAHIYQETIFSNFISSDIKYFGTWLNKDEKYRGKVLSIQYGYYSTQTMSHNNNYPIDPDLFEDFLDTNNSELIFKLNKIKSPYTKKGIYPFDTAPFDYRDTPTTKYYEYFILLKDAKSSKPLNFNED
ncbi:MAG: hypothetical protein ACRCXT_10540 [Paraclostridium sp.]